MMRSFAGVVVSVVFVAYVGLCAEYTWLGGDGLFSDAARWSPEGVPGAADEVRFNQAGPYTVSFAQAAASSNVVVGAADGQALTLDLGGFTWQVADRLRFDEADVNGVVTVSNGMLVSENELRLLQDTQTAPSALVFGEGSSGVYRNVTVGRSAVRFEAGHHAVTGLLHVSKGTQSDAVSRVTVSGTGSLAVWQLWAGSDDRATGIVEVTGGSLVVSNNFSLGDSKATAAGILNVSGGEVNLRSAVWIGNAYRAYGIVNQTGGRVYVSGGNAEFGHRMGATGLLNLSGGEFVCVGNLTAGNYENQYVSSTGILDLVAGTLVVSNTLQVGRGTNCLGVVKVGGAEAQLNNWNLGMVHPFARGVCEVTGGVVTARGTLWLGSAAGAEGRLTVTGGAVTNIGSAFVGDTGTGTVEVAGGTVRLAGTTYVGNQSTGQGLLAVSGGVCEVPVLYVGNNSGTGRVHVASGALTVHNDWVMGNTAGSSGTWVQEGGLATLRGLTGIGGNAAGRMMISGGEVNFSNTVSCGTSVGSSGYLSLAGGMVTGKELQVGVFGPSLMAISGGTNTFGPEVVVGLYTQATVNITGGSNTLGNLRVARNSTSSSATLYVTGGQTFVSGYLDIGQAGPAVFEMGGGEVTTRFLRMNPGTTTTPVPPQSEIRVTGGRLRVNEACYFPDTATITGRVTLVGGVFAVPALRQHHGRLHVLFDGGTLSPVKNEANFIRELDRFALTGNGLVVDTAGFAAGTALVLPDADGEHGRFVKQGAGTFTLNAANTFTGPVVVEGGTLALGASGLVTLAGGCSVSGGALLNLSARTLDFTLPAGTVSRVDGELRLASGRTLTVANGAALGGTGVVGRVVFESGAALVRDAADGGALLAADECVLPSGSVIALNGFTEQDLRQGVRVVAAAMLSVAPGGGVSVLLDGVAQDPVALRVVDGQLTAYSYSRGTLIRFW